MIEGYAEHGEFTRKGLKAFVDRLGGVGLKIERANSLGPFYLNAHLARPEGQKEIDKLKRMAELLVDFEIPVYGIQACQARLHLAKSSDHWIRRRGRGGYRYLHFDLDRVQALGLKPRYKVTSDQLWKGLLNIYRQVIPIVDGSKTKVAMHGNDPPLYDFVGGKQILCRFRDFDRLFSEVPSANNGITFCCGTRYESGEDVLKGIEHFGSRKQLFHVHFRNVRGTLPDDRGYSEVFVDDGDMPMGQVVRALDAVGYDGVIDFDHPVGITGEGRLPKQYISFAVGYMRGLLHNL
jgi:mannonate dehydratase